MTGAVVLERYSTIEEALVVQSLLRANGIKAELENGYHVQNDWFLIHALDGVGLVIPAKDYARSSNISPRRALIL